MKTMSLYLILILSLSTSIVGMTPQEHEKQFMSAVLLNNIDTARSLIQGIDVNNPINNKYPLKVAILQKFPDMVELLIQHGAQINTPFEGRSPLYTALLLKNYDIRIIKTLIQAGANVNEEVSGTTLISSSILQGRPDILKALIEGGASVSPKLLTLIDKLEKRKKLSADDAQEMKTMIQDALKAIPIPESSIQLTQLIPDLIGTFDTLQTQLTSK